MALLDKIHQSRHVSFEREAIVAFAVGLLLVIAGTVIGFVAAGVIGSFGARPAAAAPAAPTATASIEATAEAIRVCRAPEAAVDALPNASDQKPALTFGFLEFDWDTTEGGSMPGFGPLPATACRLSLKSLDQ